ncbi:hypothetical protein [Shumkonia mesophila]|uniref:hypothetical protein n=1 Tax=Shumkonia mesophila TaxID=2838854 RepID=UPI002934799D|nr:hypothetical protein [Shumkonia mesophila]
MKKFTYTRGEVERHDRHDYLQTCFFTCCIYRDGKPYLTPGGLSEAECEANADHALAGLNKHADAKAAADQSELPIKIEEAEKWFNRAHEQVEYVRGVVSGYEQAMADAFGTHWFSGAPEIAQKELARLRTKRSELEQAKREARKALTSLRDQLFEERCNKIEADLAAIHVSHASASENPVTVTAARVNKTDNGVDLFARVLQDSRSGWVVAKMPADKLKRAIWGPAFNSDFAANIVAGGDFISFASAWGLCFEPAPAGYLEPLMEDDDEIAAYRARLPAVAADLNAAIERLDA